MLLWNCTFTKVINRPAKKIIKGLDCPALIIPPANPVYTWTGQVYRAGFLWADWAYYISQDLFFTFLIWFWSIFFVAFTVIALSIKSFKLWKRK